MILAWLAGFGPLPAEPNARMHLERLRGAVKAAYFCQSTGLNTPRLFAETDTRRPFGYFRRALREGACRRYTWANIGGVPWIYYAIVLCKRPRLPIQRGKRP
jgi:hypothetical protein